MSLGQQQPVVAGILDQAPVSEIFVSLGLEAYNREGHRYLEKFLSRQTKTSVSG
jgi:hypothetical protein